MWENICKGGLLWWSRCETSILQCRGHRFGPWLRKMGQLSPCTTTKPVLWRLWAATTETTGYNYWSPCALEPVLRNKRSHWNRILFLEKAQAEQQRANMAQNKWINILKIFSKGMINKGLISKSTSTVRTTQYQENKQPNFRKWTEDPKRHFSKEDIEMTDRHMKRCSISLIIREMQIKTTMKYHLILARMAIIKKSTNSKCWRKCGGKRTLLHCWWECNGAADMENSGEVL